MATADPYSRSASDFKEPPHGFRTTLRHLGPGMILAGSVVGSGELIVTTKLGAVAGFTLLWFVVLSCLVKVVVQAELARHTIASGQTFLRVFNELPGPAGRRPKWLTLPWMACLLSASVAAVATFVGLDVEARTALVAFWLLVAVIAVGFGSAWLGRVLRGYRANSSADGSPRPTMNWFTWLWLGSTLLIFVNSGAILGGTGQVLEMVFPGLLGDGGARYWSILLAVVCGSLLIVGTYASLEKLLVILVSCFTLVTVICTVMLQWTGFALEWSDVVAGLSPGLPPEMTTALILTALAMYAGTGVAFGEMWNYTYWCVEKGYARSAGAPEPGSAWARRARGWIRVMYTDAVLTMVVYTVSTICFYLLGAAILNAQGLDPDGRQTLSVVSSIYTDGLGPQAAGLFLVGAFFVLVSTVLSGSAGASRMLADAMGLLGLIDASDYAVRLRYIRIFVVVSLVMYSVAYWLFENPPQMLLVTSSLIAAVMYPVLGLGTLYLRYRKVDPRIAPGAPTTAWLWVCALVLTIVSPAGILLAIAIGSGWVSFG
jgi:Mn2+/Fe2+ NRAMP family transporter